MRLRVVWGLGEMIASFSPTRAFSRVDFPAFGRPRMQTKPERKGILVLYQFQLPGLHQADAHTLHFAIGRFKDLKTQAVLVNGLAFLGNMSRQFADQTRYRR